MKRQSSHGFSLAEGGSHKSVTADEIKQSIVHFSAKLEETKVEEGCKKRCRNSNPVKALVNLELLKIGSEQIMCRPGQSARTGRKNKYSHIAIRR